LLTSLSTIASSRPPPPDPLSVVSSDPNSRKLDLERRVGLELVTIITLELFQISFLNVDTRDHFSKLGRDLLSDIATTHPVIVSTLFETTRENLVLLGRMSLYLFQRKKAPFFSPFRCMSSQCPLPPVDLPLQKWQVTQYDADILVALLRDTSNESVMAFAQLVARLISWQTLKDPQPGERPLPQLFISSTIQGQVALTLAETAIAMDSQYAQLSAAQKITTRTRFTAHATFTWSVLLSLRVNCATQAGVYSLEPYATDLVPLDYHMGSALDTLREQRANPYAAYGEDDFVPAPTLPES